MTQRSASVVVVGAGVTGLSAAWWLAQDGVDVLVLDRGVVGWEASGRNGGGCTHFHSPLFAEEQRLWPDMDARLGHPTEWRPHRVRLMFGTEDATLCAAMASAGATIGKGVRMLDPQQVRELVPLAGDATPGGIFTEFGGHANPQRTVQAYAWALQRWGGRIAQNTAVVGFGREGDRVVSVQTDQGSVGCDAVVLAAGPQTALLAAMLGVNVPLAPARAEVIVTEALPAMPHGGVDGNGLYGRQTLRGNLVYGGGPHEWLPDAPGHAMPTTPLIQSIAKRLATLFPRAAHAQVIRSWSGIVENTPDGRPVLDRLTDPANVTVATMSSVGFGLSPASGHAISELVQHGECRFADLRTMRLDRFGNLPADWRARRGWMPPDTAEAA